MASAGRVLLMPKGTWTANTAYTALDFVYYGGNSYVCKAAVSGTMNPANDTTHWQQMASGFDSDLITQTITNEPNHIASDAAVYAECQKLEAADDHFREDLASVEEAATSALVYSAGDYLMYQDQLYKAITNIAVGDPLVSGTNIRPVTVGEEMADLAASGASNTTAISQYAADMASVETTTSASKAYSIGEYLMLAGQLYKVTAAIASGGTLEVGTNITAVNLGDQLKSLNDSLTYKFTNVTGFARVSVNIGTVTINNGSNILNVTFDRTLDRIPNMLLCMMGQTNIIFIGAYGFTNNGCVIRLYNYGSAYSANAWIIAGLVIYM